MICLLFATKHSPFPSSSLSSSFLLSFLQWLAIACLVVGIVLAEARATPPSTAHAAGGGGGDHGDGDGGGGSDASMSSSASLSIVTGFLITLTTVTMSALANVVTERIYKGGSDAPGKEGNCSHVT
jgi:hypothetical protein